MNQATDVETIPRAFAELIRAQDDPDVQDAMLWALRYPVAVRVVEELDRLTATESQRP